MTASFKIMPALPDALRAEAADLYIEAFWPKFSPILRHGRARAVRLFAPTLRLDRAIVAVDGDRLLGLAGFKDADGAFLDTELSDLQRAYGWLGGLWRGVAFGLFERKPKPDELLMDGIAVRPEARGAGVGTALLAAIEAHARAQAKTTIRLDVVDTNPQARRLYERVGFKPVRTERLGFLRPIFGFSASTEMRKSLPAKMD